MAEHDFLERIRRKLALVLGDPGMVPAALALPDTGDAYPAEHWDMLPLTRRPERLVLWGSSTAQGLAPYLRPLLPTQLAFHPEGQGGERYQDVYARLGSRPAQLVFANRRIPAAGSVAVTALNLPPNRYLKNFSGTVAGISGSLGCDGRRLVFTRGEPGRLLDVPDGIEFLPAVEAELVNSIHILCCVGKNNDGFAHSAEPTIFATIEAYRWLQRTSRRVLVIGPFIDSPQHPGDPEYRWAEQVNAAWQEYFGELYLDLRGYLASAEVWPDSGLIPSAADLLAQQLGVKPPSLSRDAQHLNLAGYRAVAHRVRGQLEQLGWL